MTNIASDIEELLLRSAIDMAYRRLLDKNGELKNHNWQEPWRRIEGQLEVLDIQDLLRLYRSRRMLLDEQRQAVMTALLVKLARFDEYDLTDVVESLDGFLSKDYSDEDSEVALALAANPALESSQLQELLRVFLLWQSDEVGDDEIIKVFTQHPQTNNAILWNLFQKGSLSSGRRLLQVVDQFTQDDIIAASENYDFGAVADTEMRNLLRKTGAEMRFRLLGNKDVVQDRSMWFDMAYSLEGIGEEFSSKLGPRILFMDLLGDPSRHMLSPPLIPYGVQVSPEGVPLGDVRLPVYAMHWEDGEEREHPLMISGPLARCSIHDSATARSMDIVNDRRPLCRPVIEGWVPFMLEADETGFPEALRGISRCARYDCVVALSEHCGLPMSTVETILVLGEEWISPWLSDADWLGRWCRDNMSDAELALIADEWSTLVSANDVGID